MMVRITKNIKIILSVILFLLHHVSSVLLHSECFNVEQNNAATGFKFRIRAHGGPYLIGINILSHLGF